MTETRSPEPSDQSARRRTVALVPTALTLGNVFLGYFAIVKAFQHDHVTAAWLIVVSAVSDKLDGLVARATGTTSEFGRELDSLADLISFGVAPALMSWHWGLQPLGRLGWGLAFLFLTCGALRLARFNVMPASADRRWFVGLPIPMAAGVPVTIILAVDGFGRADQPLDDPLWATVFAVLVLASAFLMVSRVRYFAFKDVRVPRQHGFLLGLGIAVAVAAIAVFRGPALFALAMVYAGHGPVMHLTGVFSRRRPQAADGPDAADGPAAGG